MIPDKVINDYIGSLFGSSEPGGAMHHMLVAAAGPDARTAFGLPELQVSFYAIVPVGEIDADKYVAKEIRNAMARVRRERAVCYFAGLAMETVQVSEDGTELTENLARRMRADLKLQDHPAAVEVTTLYAAARDGRRWAGRHFLTGFFTGTIEGPDLLTGALTPEESGIHQRLIRAMVGLA